jgi:hypothetical protein
VSAETIFSEWLKEYAFPVLKVEKGTVEKGAKPNIY